MEAEPADQLVQRQADGVQYIELMLTLLPTRDRQTLAKTIEGETDLATMLDTLKRNGLERAVEEARRRVVDLIERVEARIKELHAQLRITPAEEPQWNEFAQVMRENARDMDQAFMQRAAVPDNERRAEHAIL